MRTHLIENDIKLFFESTPDVFLSTIKKRVKTWQTAKDGYQRNFIDFILYYLTSHYDKSPSHWVVIFDKLESLNFEFKPCHYFPDHDLSTMYTTMADPDMAFHYKQLLLGLIQRGVPFEKQGLDKFIKSQEKGMDESLMVILKSLAPIDDVVMFTVIKNNIKCLIDDAHEHALIENPSTETRMEATAIRFVLSQFKMMNGLPEEDTLGDYKKLQAEKRETILNYIHSATLTQKQALELLRTFHPCSSVMIDIDRLSRSSYSNMFVFFDKVQNNAHLPRQYFTKLQLELMDAIQDKFKVQILESV